MAYSLPSDRVTTWQPGVTYNGGIPVRNTVYATVSPSGDTTGTTDTGAINAALQACPSGQVVALVAADYYITNPGIMFEKSGYMPVNNVTLRGTVGANGLPTSVLHKVAARGGPVIRVGLENVTDKFVSSTNFTAGGAKGAFTATLASIPAGLAAGEIVLVDELSDATLAWYAPDDVANTGGQYLAWNHRSDRPVSQVMEVASIAGNVVIFTTPFHVAFRPSQTAQLARYGEGWKVAGHANGVMDAAKWDGIENVKVINDGYASHSQGNISIEHAAYCWLRNVESDHGYEGGVGFAGAFRCELRDSYIHDGWPVNGGAGYNLDLEYGAADNLVENNISWSADKVMVMRASGGGNVIAYNYMDCAYIDYNPNSTESGINPAHGTCPHMELFEGNQSFRWDMDETHGNSANITAFRNHLTGRRRIVPGVAYSTDAFVTVFTTGAHSYNVNAIGNVLGTPTGLMISPQTSWVYDKQGAALNGSNEVGAFWVQGSRGSDISLPDATRFGTDNLAWLNANAPIIRHGNYNYAVGSVAAGVVWDQAISDHALPDSLYLSGKPSFFGANPWPYVEPTTGTVNTLPARARFDVLRGLAAAPTYLAGAAAGSGGAGATAQLPVTKTLVISPTAGTHTVSVRLTTSNPVVVGDVVVTAAAVALAGAAAGAATAAAAAGQAKPLAGAGGGHAGSGASPVQAKPLSGSASGQAGAAGQEATSNQLGGAAAGHAGAQAAPSGQAQEAGAAGGQGSASAALSQAVALGGGAGGSGGGGGSSPAPPVAPPPGVRVLVATWLGGSFTFGVRALRATAPSGASIAFGVAPSGWYGSAPVVPLGGLAAGGAGAVATGPQVASPAAVQLGGAAGGAAGAMATGPQTVVQDQAATPAISPSSGPFYGPQVFTITCATPGAVIRYTTDLTDPSRANGTTYTGPVPVDHSLPLRVFAYADGYSDSTIRQLIVVIRDIPLGGEADGQASAGAAPGQGVGLGGAAGGQAAAQGAPVVLQAGQQQGTAAGQGGAQAAVHQEQPLAGVAAGHAAVVAGRPSADDLLAADWLRADPVRAGLLADATRVGIQDRRYGMSKGEAFVARDLDIFFPEVRDGAGRLVVLSGGRGTCAVRLSGGSVVAANAVYLDDPSPSRVRARFNAATTSAWPVGELAYDCSVRTSDGSVYVVGEGKAPVWQPISSAPT